MDTTALPIAVAGGLALHAAEHLLVSAKEWIQRQVSAHRRNGSSANTAEPQPGAQQHRANGDE